MLLRNRGIPIDYLDHAQPGDRLVDDFDGEVFPGWNPSETTDKIFLAGDYFLGPSTNVELFLMDFGDDLNGELRLVDISFDNIDPSTGLNQAMALTVDLNGESYTSALRSISPPRLGITVPSNEINLDLFWDPDSGCCSDLKIEFSYAIGELFEFGLDNVVVDWSVVPEPSAATVAVIITLLAGSQLLARRSTCRQQ